MENENITMLRYRGTKFTRVKDLDFFPKVEDSFKLKSSVGGTLSVISFLLICYLIYSEISYFYHSKFLFKFSPDTDLNAKLKINVDLTVAMPCNNIGADILDSTNQNAFKFGEIEQQDTWFELAPNQRRQFESERHFNSYMREEYHAIKVELYKTGGGSFVGKVDAIGEEFLVLINPPTKELENPFDSCADYNKKETPTTHEVLEEIPINESDVLWKSRFISNAGGLPPRNDNPDRPHDGCRIYGSLILNKVSGNFHITAGKSLNLPRGHIHISAFMSERDYNFTHRIHRFSFGDTSPGIIHPLEGDEMITHENMILYQYFIEIVPTSVKTFLTSVDTYQYSVKELSRPIDHHKGSHGMPGIFFKYDVSALKVHIIQERESFGMFLAKLCSIVGGIYVCSGIVNSIIQFIGSLLMCKTVNHVPPKESINTGNNSNIIFTIK